MPRKMARSGCATTVRACGMVAAVGTARQSCGRAGKAPILMPTRVSSGESRLRVAKLSDSKYVACPECAAPITLNRSSTPHIDECGFESYRFECQHCGDSLA